MGSIAKGLRTSPATYGLAMISIRSFYLFSIAILGLLYSGLACAKSHTFLIPGGAGGGWDMTARAVGETLSRSGLIDVASYENLSGGGGGRAIGYLIETAPRQTNTLMVNSSSFILRSLLSKFPHTYRDLTPVASVIADYGAFVVRIDSPYVKWKMLLQIIKGIIVGSILLVVHRVVVPIIL